MRTAEQVISRNLPFISKVNQPFYSEQADVWGFIAEKRLEMGMIEDAKLAFELSAGYLCLAIKADQLGVAV